MPTLAPVRLYGDWDVSITSGQGKRLSIVRLARMSPRAAAEFALAEALTNRRPKLKLAAGWLVFCKLVEEGAAESWTYRTADDGYLDEGVPNEPPPPEPPRKRRRR
jgi:hypothetical protein